MPQLKVLICGGGIAGNALAFWLSKLNHDVTVIERFSSLRTTGLQLDLRGHGVEVLKRMGLEQAFRAKSAPEQGVEIVSSSGRVWANFPARRSGNKLSTFTTDFEIMRGDFCRLLYDASKDRTKFMFGMTVESFEEQGDSIEVRLSDGKKDRFDLLIGADGQASRVRNIMLGTGSVNPIHPLGAYIGYFTIPHEIQEGEKYNAKIYFTSGRRAIITRRHSPHQTQAYMACATYSERLENAQRGDVSEEKEAMAEIFRGAGWQTDAILKSLQDADDFYCERLGVVKLDSWSAGRVVLVGDAAYCPTTTTGMGTTCALVGAYVLAGEIEKHCGPSGTTGKDGLSIALKEYDQKYRPFIDQTLREGGLSGDSNPWLNIPSSPLGVLVINFLIGVVAFLRLDMIAGWFSREKAGGWALPDYDEMVHGKAQKK